MSDWIGIWRLLYRLPWLFLQIFIGLPLVLLSYSPWLISLRKKPPELSDIMLRWWGRMVCRIFGLKRDVLGEFPAGPQLIVANHISWLDIKLLHSVSPMGFVAKAEIERWPLAGWVASFGETVYHHRGSHDSAQGVNEAMIERLQQGRKVAIFPEGGILPGYGVRHFHARMFAAAIDAGIPVQPVMIRYLRDGKHHERITFLKGESFLVNFFRLLVQKPCIAQVQILPAIESQGKQRRDLSRQCEAAVKDAFDHE